nr:hypothetical protein Itr_chr05CG22780 [Ipomoea trifida]
MSHLITPSFDKFPIAIPLVNIGCSHFGNCITPSCPPLPIPKTLLNFSMRI